MQAVEARRSFEAPTVVMGALNPTATHYPESLGRLEHVREFFTDPSRPHQFRILNTTASPGDFEDIPPTTLLYVGGGEGTLQKVVQSILGIVPNNPEATRQNEAAAAERAPNIRLFAGADGNACNYASSAHGRYATHPELLPYADSIHIGEHKPLIHELLDADRNVLSSGTASTGFGLGSAAHASHELQVNKPWLNKLGPAHRLLSETQLTVSALATAPHFAARINFMRGERRRSLWLPDVAGIELIGTKHYAKQGQTGVNVDDTRWQPVVQHGLESSKAAKGLHLAETAARLSLGKHVIDPVDFSGLQAEIQVFSDQPILFHADGETDPQQTTLGRDQTLRLRLSSVAIPTLMIR